MDCWESAPDGTSAEYGLSVVFGGQHCGNFGRAAALTKILWLILGRITREACNGR